MIVGVEELYRDLAAGAPAPEIRNLDAVFFEMIAGAEHFVDGRNLERHVVSSLPLPGASPRPGQRHGDPGAAHEHHASRHHCGRIYVRDPEPQHLGIELYRFFQILHHQDHARFC